MVVCQKAYRERRANHKGTVSRELLRVKEDQTTARVIAAAPSGTPGKSEEGEERFPACGKQALCVSRPSRKSGAGRKNSAYFAQNDDDQGASEVPGAKPAPGAPSDSKTHPCKNQMRKDGAPSVSLVCGAQCCLAGCSTRLGRISPKQEGRAGEG